MGIPSYFSYIIRNYKGIIAPMVEPHQKQYKHLFMDCNSIVYDCVRSFENPNPTDEEVIDSVIQKIKYYINLIRPSHTVYIAFDGVAPFAKMEQQRNRRYKSHLLSNVLKDPNNPIEKWNTTKITPGTVFMKQLSYKVSMVFQKSNANTFGVKNLIVSAANEQGEGEHKIFQYIREHPSVEDDILVYGLDSDLFMLSIFNHEYYSNCFVFREAPEFLGSLIDVNFNDMAEFYTIDINLLRTSILSNMGFHESQRIYDYVFLCFFLGNDFLPHFPALNIRTHGIQVLLDIYREIFKNKPNEFLLSKEKGIIWKNVTLIIKRLAKLETDFLIEETNMRKKYDKWEWKEPKTLEEKEKLINNLPIIYRGEETYINPGATGWEDRYYKILFGYDSKENICKNYFEGLEWVYKYYIGKGIDYRWKYNYHSGPLFKDLQNYMPRKELIKKNEIGYTEEDQLKYIMPPPSITESLTKENLTKSNTKIEWTYKRYMWESIMV